MALWKFNAASLSCFNKFYHGSRYILCPHREQMPTVQCLMPLQCESNHFTYHIFYTLMSFSTKWYTSPFCVPLRGLHWPCFDAFLHFLSHSNLPSPSLICSNKPLPLLGILHMVLVKTVAVHSSTWIAMLFTVAAPGSAALLSLPGVTKWG